MFLQPRSAQAEPASPTLKNNGPKRHFVCTRPNAVLFLARLEAANATLLCAHLHLGAQKRAGRTDRARRNVGQQRWRTLSATTAASNGVSLAAGEPNRLSSWGFLRGSSFSLPREEGALHRLPDERTGSNLNEEFIVQTKSAYLSFAA